MAVSWRTQLDHARARPVMHIGEAHAAHMRWPVINPLEGIWTRGVFRDPDHGSLAVSPTQAVFRAYTGPIHPIIERMAAWGTSDVLVRTLHDVSRELTDMDRDEYRKLADAYFSFAAFCSPICLADRGLIAIRTGQGLWWQAYVEGWPVSPPQCACDTTGLGLVVALALSPRWFTGLPYDVQAVRRAAHRVAGEAVRVEWHDEDNLVPAWHFDPGILFDD